jgi:hypothetical protein
MTNWTINQSELAFSGYAGEGFFYRGGWQLELLPQEFQGWFLLIFLCIAIVATIYAFYFIITDPKANAKPEQKPKEDEVYHGKGRRK